MIQNTIFLMTNGLNFSLPNINITKVIFAEKTQTILYEGCPK
jgi:hypothetical protein